MTPRQSPQEPAQLGARRTKTHQPIPGHGSDMERRKDGQPGVIQVPSKVTLRKYGLDAEGWLAILEAQSWVCAICKKVPKTGRFVTDHAHVIRWKKMKPEKRRTYVRGLTCWWCNKNYIGRSITVDKAVNVVSYLRAFEARMGAP